MQDAHDKIQDLFIYLQQARILTSICQRLNKRTGQFVLSDMGQFLIFLRHVFDNQSMDIDLWIWI